MGKFQGLPKPQSNFVRMPNLFFEEVMPLISGSALKVALYIIRHTWGFSEFEEPKKITVDEFINGRKRSDGSRMDQGCGVGERGISDGLKELVEFGLLEVEVDDSDKGRIKRWFRIIMEEDSVQNYRRKNSHPDPQEKPPRPARMSPPTEKDTKERNNKKDILSPPNRNGDYSRGLKGFPISEEAPAPKKDEADFLADELYAGLLEKGKITVNPKLASWAQEIRKFLKLPGRSVPGFEKIMMGYFNRINDEFMPQAFCAASFCKKFPNIEAALKRKSADTPDDQIQRVLNLLEREDGRR